jgi:hypothetical protein
MQQFVAIRMRTGNSKDIHYPWKPFLLKIHLSHKYDAERQSNVRLQEQEASFDALG